MCVNYYYFFEIISIINIFYTHTDIPPISTAWIVGIAALILVLVVLTVYLWYRVRRQRELMRQMKAAGLANFEEGSPDSINPDLALGEQADLLPYDKRYEFPRDKLKLGKLVRSVL